MAKTTDNSNTRYEKRRKRDLKKRLFLIPKLFLVFAAFFLIISIFFRAGNSVETFTALKGNIEEYVLADGYIFREQELITSPIDGYLECNVNEGQRVNEGNVISTVYNGQVDPAVTERISSIKKEIEKLEKSGSEADVYAASAVKTELNIADEAQILTQIRENKMFSDLESEKETINDYISKKQAALGNGKSDEEKLSELNDELDKLENSITGEKVEITAPRSGVFSSKIDGYEKALSIDMMGDATPSYLNNIKKEDVSSASTVTSGEAVCKVIDNYEWYFVGIIPEKDAANFEVGTNVRLKFYDLSDSIVTASVTAISKAEGGKVAITAYSTRYIDSIYTTSKVSAELLTESSEGIKVPSSALRVIDGQQGIYVIRLGVARFVPVELLYNNKEWAIIKSVIDANYETHLEIYDEVIINTKGIEDGKVVRQ